MVLPHQPYPTKPIWTGAEVLDVLKDSVVMETPWIVKRSVKN